MWMMYGANGYTGRLVSFEARKKGMTPLLAGRNEKELKRLASSLSMPFQAFELKSVDYVAEHLKGVQVLLNCAGPFSETSHIMVAACLKAGVHYLDITGELEVFEEIFAQHEKAVKKGICLVPGVGFDVLPTDCMARSLKEKFPEADRLEIYVDTRSALSPGTIKTMIEQAHAGSLARENGHLVSRGKFVSRRLDDKTWAVELPWGDLGTAHRSTGIPNISVYARTNYWMCKAITLLNHLRRPLSDPELQEALQDIVGRFYSGPKIRKLKKTKARLEVRVYKDRQLLGKQELETPNPYELTADSSVRAVKKMLENRYPPGAYTPAQIFGASFLQELI